MTSLYHHNRYGLVEIVTGRARRNVIATLRNGRPRLSVPPGLTPAMIDEYISRLVPRLLARRGDSVSYHDGMRIDVAGFSIEFTSQTFRPDKISIGISGARGTVSVGSAIGWDDNTPLISRALETLAVRAVAAVVIPQGAAIARRFGVSPAGWRAMRAARRLGVCDARGIIGLSGRCLFLDDELREFVICHELAHLTHLNHSAAFHALCNRYLGGREAALAARLKTVRFPLL